MRKLSWAEKTNVKKYVAVKSAIEFRNLKFSGTTVSVIITKNVFVGSKGVCAEER